MDSDKRRQNEKKFGRWQPLPEGGRRYLYEVPGRRGWKALYIKEVNAQEETTRFYQEIYNSEGKLVEMHQKFPTDTGHQRMEQEP